MGTGGGVLWGYSSQGVKRMTISLKLVWGLRKCGYTHIHSLHMSSLHSAHLMKHRENFTFMMLRQKDNYVFKLCDYGNIFSVTFST
jgi:hypothetical protein